MLSTGFEQSRLNPKRSNGGVKGGITTKLVQVKWSDEICDIEPDDRKRGLMLSGLKVGDRVQ